MHLVLLEDNDSAEVLDSPTGAATFDDMESAVTAARAALRGMEPGRIWASVFELQHVETIRPE